MKTTIKTGDTVKIKTEWLNPGEAQVEYVATEDEADGLVAIRPKVSTLAIVPIETVETSMLQN